MAKKIAPGVSQFCKLITKRPSWMEYIGAEKKNYNKVSTKNGSFNFFKILTSVIQLH